MMRNLADALARHGHDFGIAFDANEAAGFMQGRDTSGAASHRRIEDQIAFI